MPDDCGWTEGNNPAGLLDSPAKVNIVPCLTIFDIESPHGFECPTIKRHVAARNVLSHNICKQDMARSARRCRNAGLDPVFCGRSDIRSTYSGVITTYESPDKVIEPVRINHAVGIGVGEDFALGFPGACVPRIA